MTADYPSRLKANDPKQILSSVMRSLSCSLLVVMCQMAAETTGQQPAGDQAKGPLPVQVSSTVRIATCQAQGRNINGRIIQTADVLAEVEKNLDELEKIVHHASDQKCDVLTLPEETLGLLHR